MVDLHDTPSYSSLPRWESTAGKGPRLRGRRADGQGPWIHFLHGNGFCGGVYWPFLRGFTTDHSLFLHDIEGHGESEPPERFSGVSAIVRRMPQVLDAQALPASGLIGMGHSFGGALTLRLADAQPQRFRALVLLDPILMPRTHWWGVRLITALGRNPMANGALRRRARWRDAEEVRERLRGRGIYRGWTEEALQHFVDHATRDTAEGRELCCPTWLESHIFGRPIYPWDALRRLQIPTLFLYGRESYPFFAHTVARVGRLCPTVEVQAIPGGHCFMQEDPEATQAVVRDFLARHAA